MPGGVGSGGLNVDAINWKAVSIGKINVCGLTKSN